MISSLVWDGGARKRAHFLQHFCFLWTCFSIRPPNYTLEEYSSQLSSSQRRVKNQLHQLYEEVINCTQDPEGTSWNIIFVAPPIPPEASSFIKKKKFCPISWITEFCSFCCWSCWRRLEVQCKPNTIGSTLALGSSQRFTFLGKGLATKRDSAEQLLFLVKALHIHWLCGFTHANTFDHKMWWFIHPWWTR